MPYYRKKAIIPNTSSNELLNHNYIDFKGSVHNNQRRRKQPKHYLNPLGQGDTLDTLYNTYFSISISSPRHPFHFLLLYISTVFFYLLSHFLFSPSPYMSPLYPLSHSIFNLYSPHLTFTNLVTNPHPPTLTYHKTPALTLNCPRVYPKPTQPTHTPAPHLHMITTPLRHPSSSPPHSTPTSL